MNEGFQFVCLVVLAPLVQGLLRSLRAQLQGRPGPTPIQPYRDLRKLWSKEALVPAATSPLVIATPGIVLGVALTFAALVPPVFRPGSTAVNAVAMALLLALSRFVLVLAALDARSAFSAMAASREMTFASLTEAPLILALLSSAVSASPDAVSAASTPIAGVLAAGALLLVMLSETARIPVDNQETHYELTMIHEGLVLEYSGWELALLQLAAYVRQAAFFVLGARMLPGTSGLTLLYIVAFILMIPLVERIYAKMRLFEVPQLFASATVLALASIGLRIAGLGTW
ncbi:MAG: NADH-quinone oxidoreductase subunit H [Candidatus Velthaea sp.]|jgi:formate hydrogenlyase subunit 4